MQHVFLFVLGFPAGRLLMRNWVCFAIFRIGSQMASFRKSRAAKATPKLRMIARLYFTDVAMPPSPRNGGRLLIMNRLITNWVRFAIFRIGCQMASFRKHALPRPHGEFASLPACVKIGTS